MRPSTADVYEAPPLAPTTYVPCPLYDVDASLLHSAYHLTAWVVCPGIVGMADSHGRRESPSPRPRLSGGKKRSLLKEKLIWTIFGPQYFWASDPLPAPPPLLIPPWVYPLMSPLPFMCLFRNGVSLMYRMMRRCIVGGAVQARPGQTRSWVSHLHHGGPPPSRAPNAHQLVVIRNSQLAPRIFFLACTERV